MAMTDVPENLQTGLAEKSTCTSNCKKTILEDKFCIINDNNKIDIYYRVDGWLQKDSHLSNFVKFSFEDEALCKELINTKKTLTLLKKE